MGREGIRGAFRREEPMSESRGRRLQELLKRLGEAVHRSVVDSEEVQECLQEIHADGWDAVMLLEASLACREDGEVESIGASLHVHADPGPPRVHYRLNLQDARWLTSIGISPTRHREENPAPLSPEPGVGDPDAEPRR